MIGARNHGEPRRDTGRAPALDDGPALPKIFRAFVFAYNRIETAAPRRIPEQRARRPGRSGIETQGIVDRGLYQRTQIEQARNGVGRNDEVFGQRRIERRPVGREQAGREMPTGGMAADDERLPQPRQLTRSDPHLLDNTIDGDIRTQIVAGYSNADPVCVQPRGEMAGRRAVQRLPIAAVHKHDNRSLPIAGKEIDDIPLARTIGNNAWRAARAIGRGVARPAGHQRGIFRNPRPVVVFDLVVDISAQDATTLVFARISAPSPWSWPTAASTRGHP